MSIGHFHIPGEATRREYAVYIMVAAHRVTGQKKVYIGKTGDNRDGCNPVISRAGNHFSFNKIHSQMRNYLEPGHPHDFDFDYFYTTFGEYRNPEESREGIDLINEMERQLNRFAQRAFGAILNPYLGKGKLTREKEAKRTTLATEERLGQLRLMIRQVQDFLGAKQETAEIIELDDTDSNTPANDQSRNYLDKESPDA